MLPYAPLEKKVGGLCKAMVGLRHWVPVEELILSGVQHFFFFFHLRFRQKIERITLEGLEREVIVSRANNPFGLAVYGQYVYWSDWFTKKIYRANKYDGSSQTAMTTTLPFLPKGIRAVVKDQQQCHNPCDQFNGGCSHICAPGKALAMKIDSWRVIIMMTTSKEG